MPTFLVTGHMRSGTSWLAKALDRSSTWTVRHEGLRTDPTTIRQEPPDRWHTPERVAEHFRDAEHEHANYGEVSCFLVGCVDAPVDRKAVILRDPYELALSCMNRHSWSAFEAHCDARFRLIDALAERRDFLAMKLSRLATVAGLAQMAGWLGVTDLDIDESLATTKVNEAVHRDYDRLPDNERAWVERTLGWFRAKWGFA